MVRRFSARFWSRFYAFGNGLGDGFTHVLGFRPSKWGGLTALQSQPVSDLEDAAPYPALLPPMWIPVYTRGNPPNHRHPLVSGTWATTSHRRNALPLLAYLCSGTSLGAARTPMRAVARIRSHCRGTRPDPPNAGTSNVLGSRKGQISGKELIRRPRALSERR